MNAMSSIKLGKQLALLYATDTVFAALVDWFYQRRVGSLETKVRVAASKTRQSESDIRSTFTKLEELGIGVFILGRRGAESRMRWNYDVKSLALVARGDIDEPVDVSEVAQEGDDDDDLNGSLVEHEFRLRAEFKVTVALPVDLTKGEAERLSAWVKSLPFE